MNVLKKNEITFFLMVSFTLNLDLCVVVIFKKEIKSEIPEVMVCV